MAKYSEVCLILATRYSFEKCEFQFNQNLVLLQNLIHLTAWDTRSKQDRFIAL